MHASKSKAFLTQFKKLSGAIQNLKNRKFSRSVKEFDRIWNRYKRQEISLPDYLHYLKATTSSWARFPTIKLLMDLQDSKDRRKDLEAKMKSVDAVVLFQELEKLELAVIHEITENDIEKDLFKLTRQFELLDKGLNFSLLRPEKEQFEAIRGDLGATRLQNRFKDFNVTIEISPFVRWDEVLQNISGFYDAAEARETVFQERIRSNPNSIVLIGGYHTLI